MGLSFYGFADITRIDLPTGTALYVGSVFGQSIYTSVDLATWQLKYTATDIASKTPAHPSQFGWSVVAGMAGARPFSASAVVPHATISGIYDYKDPTTCITQVEAYVH